MLKNQKTYWQDNAIYFLTGSTFLRYPYFKEDDQKLILLNQIKKIQQKLNIPVSAYSIAVNHYHLKFFLKHGLDLAKVKQIMHGGTSFIYRQKHKMKYTDLWQSSKTLTIATEEADYKIAGYIAGNLLKHKEVSTFDELYNNQFSSYKYMADKHGKECSKDLIYQVIDVEENVEGEVDFGAFDSVSGIQAAKAAEPSAKAG